MLYLNIIVIGVVNTLDEDEVTLNIKQRFARSFLDMIVLSIIRSRPIWGYRIIANMNENFGVKIGYGTMYPLLKSLRTKALIKSGSKRGERRKIYEITIKGRKVINLYTELLKEQLQLLETES